MKRIFFLFLALFLAISCKRMTAEKEMLPLVTLPLSRSLIGYGVIGSSYAHILDKRGDTGESVGIVRKGAIVEILERRPLLVNDKTSRWVFVSDGNYSGWLLESELQIYDSKAQAETAANSLVQ
jgi:hypothetical protein